MVRNSEKIFSNFSRPVQASCHKTLESSKLKSSTQFTQWTVEDVSQIIRAQYNDKVAKKFEGQ